MKRIWSSEELNTHWALSIDDHTLLKGKSDAGRILFSVLIKYYQRYACFPQSTLHISDDVWDFVAGQLGLTWQKFDVLEEESLDRVVRRYTKEIRGHLGIGKFNHQGRALFKTWALENLFPMALDPSARDAEIQNWFCHARYELPGKKVLRRLVGATEQAFERLFLTPLLAI